MNKKYEPKACKLCVSLKSHVQLYQLPFVGLIPQLVSCFTFSIEIGQRLRSYHFKISLYSFSSGGHLVHWSGAVLAILVEIYLETFLCSLS